MTMYSQEQVDALVLAERERMEQSFGRTFERMVDHCDTCQQYILDHGDPGMSDERMAEIDRNEQERDEPSLTVSERQR